MQRRIFFYSRWRNIVWALIYAPFCPMTAMAAYSAMQHGGWHGWGGAVFLGAIAVLMPWRIADLILKSCDRRPAVELTAQGIYASNAVPCQRASWPNVASVEAVDSQGEGKPVDTVLVWLEGCLERRLEINVCELDTRPDVLVSAIEAARREFADDAGACDHSPTKSFAMSTSS